MLRRCLCIEAQRGHCAKLWRWSLDWLGDPKMVEMPELWVTFKGEWNQPMRKRCIAVNKDERSWRSEKYFDVRHGNTRVWSLPSWFSVQYFFTILPFRITMYILCHYVEAHREQQTSLELMECAYRFAQSWWCDSERQSSKDCMSWELHAIMEITLLSSQLSRSS